MQLLLSLARRNKGERLVNHLLFREDQLDLGALHHLTEVVEESGVQFLCVRTSLWIAS